MIIATLLLDSISVVVLFNSGSTHTFIVENIVPQIGVGLEDLGYNLIVIAPIRAVLTTKECVRGVVAIQ